MAIIKIARIEKTKYGTYSLNYANPDGRRRRLSVGKDYQLAQRQAIRFTDWLLSGKDPEIEMEKFKREEKAKKITLRDFYPTFLERHGNLQSRSMREIYKYRFKQILRCLTIVDVPLSEISRGAVFRYMYARKNEGEDSNATINREISMLRCMLNRAVDWEILIFNPLNGFKLLSESGKRNVNLTPEQAAELIARLPYPASDIIELAIYSSFRKGNIYDLKIEQIHFNNESEDTPFVELKIKGGEYENFPIGPHFVEIIKRNIGVRKNGYVFFNPNTGTHYKDIHKHFDKAVRDLNLTVNGTKLRIHDLRHVAPTWLHQKGFGDDVLQELLRHKDKETTERYITRSRSAVANVLSSLPTIERKETGKLKLVKRDTG